MWTLYLLWKLVWNMQMQQNPEERSSTWAFTSHFSTASSSPSSFISLFGWTHLMQPLIIYIFQGNCKSPRRRLALKWSKKKWWERRRGGGEWKKEGGEGGVKRELVSVCHNRSSRSLFHSGIFGFFSLDAVARGWTLPDFLVCLAAVCEDAACLACRHGPLVTL